MTNKNLATTELETPALETVENALSELELDDTIEEPVIEELSGEEAAALSLKLTKDEVYASAPAAVKIAADIAEPAAKKERKPRDPSKVKAAKPAIVRDLASLSAAAFVLDNTTSLTPDEHKKIVLAAKPTQKKIAEKWENIFVSIAAGKAPSKYVVDLFRILNSKKSVSSNELVAAMMGSTSGRGAGYGEGTARSQTGQIMALFSMLRIANRSGNVLTLNTDSAIADFLRKFI